MGRGSWQRVHGMLKIAWPFINFVLFMLGLPFAGRSLLRLILWGLLILIGETSGILFFRSMGWM